MSALATSDKDVLMSIKPEHINNIVVGTKNHEYRKYRLPTSVERIWFYTTAPVSSFQYIALISTAKEPGQVQEDGGIGNEDFNAGKKVSKYGYEILMLWKLRKPLTLQEAIEKDFVKGPPQKYSWVKEAMRQAYSTSEQELILNRLSG